MVWAQAVDAVEVLRYNGRVSGKGCGQVLRPLKYFQSVVRLCSFAQGGYALPAENDLVCGQYILRFRLVDWAHRLTARRQTCLLYTSPSPRD